MQEYKVQKNVCCFQEYFQFWGRFEAKVENWPPKNKFHNVRIKKLYLKKNHGTSTICFFCPKSRDYQIGSLFANMQRRIKIAHSIFNSKSNRLSKPNPPFIFDHKLRLPEIFKNFKVLRFLRFGIFAILKYVKTPKTVNKYKTSPGNLVILDPF